MTKSLLYYIFLHLLSLTPSSTVAYCVPSFFSPCSLSLPFSHPYRPHWVTLKTFLLVTMKKASQAFMNVSPAAISHMPVVNSLVFDVPNMVSCDRNLNSQIFGTQYLVHCKVSVSEGKKIKLHILASACSTALGNSVPGPEPLQHADWHCKTQL